MHSSKYLSLLAITSVFFLAGAELAAAEVSKPAESKSAETSPKKKQVAEIKSSVPRGPQEKAKGKLDEVKEESATYTVEAKPLKIIAKLSGVVESKHQTPVAMDLNRWTELSIVSVVPHGWEVKKGDLLFQLDTKALEKKIRELEVGMPLKELDLETAKQELEKIGQTTPLQLEEAHLAMKHAEEDLEYFFEVTKPMRERSAKEDLKSSENYLSYAEEELRQLKKMYDEDDMTEETEEIILQRQQNSVDNYKWVFEQTKARTDRTLNTSIPREEESLKSKHVLKEIDFVSSEKATKDSVIRKELDVEAKIRAFDETELALKEYRSDLKQMAPKARHDGLVYYGMNQRGKWTTASTIERKMIPGGKLSMNEVAVTIVDPNNLHLRLTVPENKLKGLKPGLGGTLKLEWNPDVGLQGKVEAVSRVPYADNTYDAVVSIPADAGTHIVPGMKATVEVVIYDNEKTLIVPKNAIEKKGKASVVTMASGEKRRIRTGHSSGSMIEVVEGLKADDEIRKGASEKDEPVEEKNEEKSEEKVGDKK
jgi:multidrug efflux pump subunit AcrA (membrane-fusion protein)